jgi:hypothetical protein
MSSLVRGSSILVPFELAPESAENAKKKHRPADNRRGAAGEGITGSSCGAKIDRPVLRKNFVLRLRPFPAMLVISRKPLRCRPASPEDGDPGGHPYYGGEKQWTGSSRSGRSLPSSSSNTRSCPCLAANSFRLRSATGLLRPLGGSVNDAIASTDCAAKWNGGKVSDGCHFFAQLLWKRILVPT